MKRDMLEQMEFQTKMRKMKEQEISKYSHYEDVPSDGMGIARGTAAAIKVGDDAGHVAGAPTDGAMKGGTEAIGMTDAEFWKSDEVLDDQLFELLMNDLSLLQCPRAGGWIATRTVNFILYFAQHFKYTVVLFYSSSSKVVSKGVA